MFIHAPRFYPLLRWAEVRSPYLTPTRWVLGAHLLSLRGCGCGWASAAVRGPSNFKKSPEVGKLNFANFHHLCTNFRKLRQHVIFGNLFNLFTIYQVVEKVGIPAPESSNVGVCQLQKNKHWKAATSSNEKQ